MAAGTACGVGTAEDLQELRAESISALAVFLSTTMTWTPALCNFSRSLPLYFCFVLVKL